MFFYPLSQKHNRRHGGTAIENGEKVTIGNDSPPVPSPTPPTVKAPTSTTPTTTEDQYIAVAAAALTEPNVNVNEARKYLDQAKALIDFKLQSKQEKVPNQTLERFALLTSLVSSAGGSGGGGGKAGSGGGGSQDEKQATFDCAQETEQASKFGELDFTQVVGMKREKNEFRTSFIYPFLYEYLFPVGKGILLYGPPGTGKTLISKAAAVELNKILEKDLGIWDVNRPSRVLFFSLTSSQLKGKFVGQTEKNIEAAFDCAQKAAEKRGESAVSLIFLDEVEVLGGKRGQSQDIGLNAAVTTLLTVIDGTTKRNLVRVIAATNRPWDLDDAILSRFPLKIFVDTPGDEARRDLIYTELAKFYGRGRPQEQYEMQRYIKRYNEAASTEEKGFYINKLKKTLVKYLNDFFPPAYFPALFSKNQKQEADLVNDLRVKVGLRRIGGSAKAPAEAGKQKNDDQVLISWIEQHLKNEEQKDEDYRKLFNYSVTNRDTDVFNHGVVFYENGKKLVDDLTIQTGMNQAGYNRLRASMTSDRLNNFLKEAGKETRKGISEMGYANRDLVNLIQQAIRNAGLRFFKTQQTLLPSNLKCFLDCEVVKKGDADCQPCNLSRIDRYLLRGRPLIAEDFDQALAQVPSSVNGAEYVKYVLYMFNDAQVIQETSNVNISNAPADVKAAAMAKTIFSGGVSGISELAKVILDNQKTIFASQEQISDFLKALQPFYNFLSSTEDDDDHKEKFAAQDQLIRSAAKIIVENKGWLDYLRTLDVDQPNFATIGKELNDESYFGALRQALLDLVKAADEKTFFTLVTPQYRAVTPINPPELAAVVLRPPQTRSGGSSSRRSHHRHHHVRSCPLSRTTQIQTRRRGKRST